MQDVSDIVRTFLPDFLFQRHKEFPPAATQVNVVVSVMLSSFSQVLNRLKM